MRTIDRKRWHEWHFVCENDMTLSRSDLNMAKPQDQKASMYLKSVACCTTMVLINMMKRSQS